jgi:Peptidase family M28/PDZ domain/PA domain
VLPRRGVWFAGSLGLGVMAAWALGVQRRDPDVTPIETTSTTRIASPTASAELEQRARDIEIYRKHVEFIGDPALEGRAPGTHGNRVAANYIENAFRRLNLKPAFQVATAGTEAKTVESYRQAFEARPSERPGDSIKLKSQAASFTTKDGVAHALESGVDFNALGHSASGEASGPLVFVGYAVENEGQKYRSIPEGTDLKGKIAVLFRLEPMKDDGTSKWAENDWSFQAGLEQKLITVSKAGAAGIILTNPPGAAHPDATKLANIGLGSRRFQPVPVVMVSGDAGERLLRAADEQGRGLMDFRRLADELGEGQSGVIGLPGVTASLAASIERFPLMTDNVGAILPGAGALAEEIVVIGAHYDHIGYGYFGSRGGPEARGVIHAGADDNASGTAGILLAAERLARAYEALPADKSRRSVLFLAFSAEESGLEGSKFYVKNAIATKEKHAFMLNMDMIGRMRENHLDVSGTGTAEGFGEWLKPIFERSGIDVASKPGGSGPSDHASFYGWEVPVLFAFTGLHEDYHRPSDVVETLNVEGAVRIASLASEIVLEGALRAEPFVFVSTSSKPAPTTDQAANPHGAAAPGATPSPGPIGGGSKIRFGIAPGDYSGSEKGVLIGEVYPDTPAAKGGLRKGDIITHWNGKELLDVESWMPLFSAAKPGDHVVIAFRRKVGDEFVEMSTAVELVARKTGGQ